MIVRTVPIVGKPTTIVAVHGLCMANTELNRKAHNHADALARGIAKVSARTGLRPAVQDDSC